MKPAEIKILVVDDNPDIRDGTQMVLEKVGYSVATCASGEAALEAVRQGQPHLVLLDRDLPGIDGLEVCRRIKQDPAAMDCLVVLASGTYVGTEDQAEGLEAQADGYITRPVANRELLARVGAFARMIELKAELRAKTAKLEQSARDSTASHLATLNMMEDTAKAKARLEETNRQLRLEIAERERAEQALRESERLLNQAQQTAKMGSYLLDIPSQQWTCSAAMERVFGIGSDYDKSLAGWTALIHPDERAMIKSYFKNEVVGRGQEFNKEYRIIRASDQAVRWIWSRGELDLDGQGLPMRMRGTVQDVTERKLAEMRIKRLSRFYQALGRCNEAIVRCENREQLFGEVCRLAVEYCGIKMAWIGLADYATREVRVAASHGEDTDYLAGIEVTTGADKPTGRGPTGTAIREGRTVVVDNFKTDSSTSPWHERAANFDWRSLASLPLLCREVVVGALTLYVGAEGAFDPETIGLLEQMAADVSLGLDAFATEGARDAAEVALREAHDRHVTMIATTADGFWVIGGDGRVIDVNENYCRMAGYTREEMLARRLSDFVASEPPELIAERMREIEQNGFARFESQHRRKDGSVWDVEVSNSFRIIGAGHIFQAFIRDITDRNRIDRDLHESLREKEALLKEVHHRVKNNLQVITSLLRLESARQAEAGTVAVLRDMQGRIRSMALMHETLYRSGNFAQVDLAVYLERVATQGFRAQQVSTGRLKLQLELARIVTSIDQAIPCGLLLNELISNALKHAFPNDRSGTITVGLQAAKESAHAQLRVADTGVGLPADLAERSTRSLGLQLAGDLARQLGGTLQTSSGPGAEFTISFPTNFAPPTL